MRGIHSIFCFLITIVTGVVNTCHASLSVGGDDYTFNQTYLHWESADRIDVDKLYLKSSMHILNDGWFMADDVYVDSGHDIEIENHSENMKLGTIHADGSSVVQLITSNNSVTDIGANLDIVVRDATDVSLNKLLDISDGVKNITFKNSDLYMDEFVNFENIEITFLNDVNIILRSVADVVDTPVFHGVLDTAPLTITAKDINPMFALQPYNINGTVYVRIVRETDYTRFMDEDVGAFLNSLHVVDNASKFMREMNAAQDMNEIHNVMRRGVYTNPILLMRGVRALHANMMFDLPNKIDNAITIRPFTIFGDNENTYGVRGGAHVAFGDNMSVGVHVHMGQMHWNDEINEYSSNMFGGGINLNWDNDRIVGRGAIGVTMATFDIDAVYDNGEIYDAPIAHAFYAGGDLGARFMLSDDMEIIPFIGVTGDSGHIANSSDSDFDANAGADFGFNGAAYDVHYRYSLRGRVSVNGEIGVGGRIALSSDVDGIAGDVSFMRVTNNDATFNEVSLMLRMSF